MALDQETKNTLVIAATNVIKAATAIVKECSGEIATESYLREKAAKAASWLRIIEGHLEEGEQ